MNFVSFFLNRRHNLANFTMYFGVGFQTQAENKGILKEIKVGDRSSER